MERLTTDTPKGNFENMLNYVYSKDGRVYIRHDGINHDVPLAEWAKRQCVLHGCDDFPQMSDEEVDQELCDCMMDAHCPTALAYCFASQAVHLRDRLKLYEDTGLGPDEITKQPAGCVFYCNRKCNLDGDWCSEGPGCPYEMYPEAARRLAARQANAPLPLEELRQMGGEPVWICKPNGIHGSWALVDARKEICRTVHGETAFFHGYGGGWLAYRRKPEEVK